MVLAMEFPKFIVPENARDWFTWGRPIEALSHNPGPFAPPEERYRFYPRIPADGVCVNDVYDTGDLSDPRIHRRDALAGWIELLHLARPDYDHVSLHWLRSGTVEFTDPFAPKLGDGRLPLVTLKKGEAYDFKAHKPCAPPDPLPDPAAYEPFYEVLAAFEKENPKSVTKMKMPDIDAGDTV